MSGFLKKNICPDNHSIWGLVKSPDKNVIAVKVGDRIGKENIIITAITPSGIQLQTLEKTKCFIPATSTALP
jgi:Tfp pilus assembly protein PilP